MKKLIEKYNGILLLGFMVGAGGINYLFQIVIGRSLTVEEYGTINSLLSFTSILSVPGTILAMIISKQIAVTLAKGNWQKVKSVARVLITATITAGIGLTLMELLLSGVIGRAIHVENRWFIWICCLISGLSIMVQAFAGTIQGLQKFLEYGFQSFVTATSKIVLAVLLIKVGYHVGGALGGMLLAQVITIGYCAYALGKTLFPVTYCEVDKKSIFIECSKDFAVIALGQICISILTNCDLILVKRYFNETDAGIYSAAIIIARLVMYVSTMLIYVLFPKAAQGNAQGKNTKGLFVKSLAANLVIIFAGCIGIWIMGEWLIRLFLGENYLQSFDMINTALLYIVPVSVFTIITNYVSATSQVKFFMITSMIGTIGVLASAVLCHQTIRGMLLGMGIVMCILCMINIVYVLSRRQK